MIFPFLHALVANKNMLASELEACSSAFNDVKTCHALSRDTTQGIHIRQQESRHCFTSGSPGTFVLGRNADHDIVRNSSEPLMRKATQRNGKGLAHCFLLSGKLRYARPLASDAC